MTVFGGSRSVAVRLGLDAKGYLTGLASAGKATKDWARAADQSLGKHRRSWDDIGNSATKAGLVIGAGAAAAVVAFAQFDKSMSRAQAGTQATAREMDQLRAAALKAGADTQFSATQAADAITAMGKAGVGVGDILGGGLQGALSLAAAGELEVGDAAEIAATALTQFGLRGSDLPHVADLLAAGAGKAQGSVTDLSLALKYVGPVAKSAGVSLEETVGAIAELSSQGIIGEQAGTSLRGVLQSLRGPSAAAKKEMAALGITLYDSNGNFIGLAAAAEQLRTKLGGLPPVQRDAALATMFGNEQVTAATVLMNGGAAAVKKWTAAVNDQGYAARQAGQLMDNLAGDVEQLQGSLETAFIQSGSGSNSGLRTLVQGATGAVNAFGGLPPKLQQSVVVAAGLTAGAALLTAGVIKGALAVRTMRTNLDELGVSGARAKGVLGGVGKVAGAVGAVALAATATSELGKQLGVVGDGSSKMQLELANYAQGAALAGDSAKLFGANLQGQRSATNLISQDLKSLVNDLSGVNGWWNKDIPFIGSDEADQVKALGQALAGLATSGHADTAAAAFARMAKDAGLNAEEQKRLLALMPEYSGFLTDIAAKQVATGEATAGTADAMSVLGQQMGTTAFKAGQLQQKLADVRDEAKKANEVFLQGRSAQREYQQALDDARELLSGGAAAAKVKKAEERVRTAKTPQQKAKAEAALAKARADAAKEGVSLDINTDAGRRGAAALDAVAEAAQRQADALLAAGGTDEQYRAALAKSREELLKLAVAFGMSKSQAQSYVDQVLRIPDKVSTDVTLSGADGAIRQLGTLTTLLGRVTGGKVAQVQVSADSATNREDLGGKTYAPGPNLPKRAAGGPVAAGRDYLVGERRPEVFRPASNGYVFPSVAAAASAGGGPQVVKVPVTQVHRRETPVHIGNVTVVAQKPSQFTDWAGTQASFGLAGVG